MAAMDSMFTLASCGTAAASARSSEALNEARRVLPETPAMVTMSQV
jgi:hypothetical protein